MLSRPETQYLEEILRGIAEWKQKWKDFSTFVSTFHGRSPLVEIKAEIYFHFSTIHLPERSKDTMAGIPHKSSLIPHEAEILALRRRRPPVPYQRIAELLREKYNLVIQYPAIFKFVKLSRRRKVRSYKGGFCAKKANLNPKKIARAVPASRLDPNAEFEFTYSDRYNLTRLSPEEAAALKKKLEEERH